MDNINEKIQKRLFRRAIGSVIVLAAAMMVFSVNKYFGKSGNKPEEKEVSVTTAQTEASQSETEYIPVIPVNLYDYADNTDEYNSDEYYGSDDETEYESSIPDDFPDIPQDLFNWFYKFSEYNSELKEYEYCMEFIDLSPMLEEWKSWMDFYDDESMNDSERFHSEPEGAVKRMYCNRNWVPIARDSGGNYIGVDLDPDENGVYGQIINFGRDEKTKYVFADSINEFYNLLIENKEELSSSSHLTDGLIKFLYKNNQDE